MNKPFKTYNGGKAGNGTYQKIINHIPKCDVFVDAMVGNGGIFLNLNLPQITVINDIDTSVIDKYNKVLIDKHNYEGHNKNIIVENIDYRSLIDKYDDVRSKVCFYFDPPYLMETRKSNKKLYTFDWELKHHENFLLRAVTVKSNVIISHYPCDLYDKYLNGWYMHDFQSMTRNGLRTERIYMNYPKPYILQDYRYLGSDYRDRQRIKRKINRFISKLDGLPTEERTGILSAVIAKYDDTAVKLLRK